MKIKLLGLLVLSTLAMIVGVGSASATPKFKAFEVSAWWSMDHPNLDNPDSYEWPQTFVKRGIEPPSATCVAVKYQFDKYWIRSADDYAYFKHLITVKLTGAQDDQRLSPHDYFPKIIKDASLCVTDTPTPTPTTQTPTPTPTTDTPTPTTSSPTPTPTACKSPLVPTQQGDCVPFCDTSAAACASTTHRTTSSLAPPVSVHRQPPLAVTGFDTGLAAIIGSLTIGVGGLLLLAGRRRSH